MKDVFDSYHPIISFGYFFAVIISAIIFMEPVCLVISLTGAVFYAVYLKGLKAVKFFICMALPVMLISIAINFFFNHHGVTILFYIGGNPVTKEAVWYASAAAFMFAAVIMWFYCYNEIVTSDKFIYIFGRLMPVISLVFSMIMRFILRFTSQLKHVHRAQIGMNMAGSEAEPGNKLRSGMKVVSIMVSWALENSIDTADSMKARGYGLPGRTAWSLFRFDKRDAVILSIITSLIALLVIGTLCGFNTMRYYPELIMPRFGTMLLIDYFAYGALCFAPVALNLKEDLKWRYLKSKI